MAMIEAAATSQTPVSPNSSIRLPLHAPLAIEPYLAPLPPWTETERASSPSVQRRHLLIFPPRSAILRRGRARRIYLLDRRGRCGGLSHHVRARAQGRRQIVSFYTAGEIRHRGRLRLHDLCRRHHERTHPVHQADDRRSDDCEQRAGLPELWPASLGPRQSGVQRRSGAYPAA